MPYSKKDYDIFERSLANGLHDLAILAGDITRPSDVSWQDVAGTAASNLKVIVTLLEEAREKGWWHESPVFPSPWECMGEDFRQSLD